MAKLMAQYHDRQEVQVVLPGMDGFVALNVLDAAQLHAELGAILYGTPDSPKQVR